MSERYDYSISEILANQQQQHRYTQFSLRQIYTAKCRVPTFLIGCSEHNIDIANMTFVQSVVYEFLDIDCSFQVKKEVQDP